MSYYLSDSWQIGTSAVENFMGDRYGVTRNDVFQLSGSESGTVGGVNNNWDSYHGGQGYDTIWVSPKSGYYWTAVMIAQNGLDNVERIFFNTSGPKPIYFKTEVDFASVTSMNADAKIFGREGNDIFHGGSLGEHAEGDAGDDTLYGNGGNDILIGDSSENPWAISYANNGNDKLFGGDGDDTLAGQGGNDILNGGSGVNMLIGDVGADKFQVTDAHDHSKITDFVSGTDKIQIDTALAAGYSNLEMSMSGSDTHVKVGDVDITIVGISVSTLNASDFEFGAFA